MDKYIYDLQEAINNHDHRQVGNLYWSHVDELMFENKYALVRAVRYAGIQVSDEIDSDELKKIIEKETYALNVRLIQCVLEVVVFQKAEYSNFIGQILAAGGGLVKGIADAASAGIKAKSERDVLNEKTNQLKLGVEKAKTGILGDALDYKSGKEKVMGAELQKLSPSLVKSQTVLTATMALCAVFLAGLIITVIVLKSKE